MKTKKICILLLSSLLPLLACTGKKGPNTPDSQGESEGATAENSSANALPIGSVIGQDTTLGSINPTGGSLEGSQNVPDGSTAAGTPKTSPPEPSTTPPVPPAPPPPPPFYPASCAEIKTAKPTATSGPYKIYLNPSLATRVALDASCDMTEDNGGWTLILNYVHLANTNPPLTVRATDLPVLAGDTLGTDESALTKNWGHSSNAMLSNFVVKELRFYCRSTLTQRIVHFKSADPGCLTAARTGAGGCLGLAASFTALTGHTGILPAGGNRGRMALGDLTLTDDMLAKDEPGFDPSWSIKGDTTSWECDFGTNDGISNTIHRVWFR